MRRSEIPNHDLKRAVMAAPIKHAGVALKALHQIDTDAKFRDAAAAAVATEDREVVARFVYAHFQPELEEADPNDHYTRLREKIPKLEPPIDATQLIRTINDRTVEIAAAYLTEGTLDEAVEEFIGDRLTQLIMLVLGLRDDGYGESLRFDSREGTEVAAGMRELVISHVGPLINQLLSAVDPTQLLTAGKLKRATKAIKDAYKEAADEYLNERIDEWAREHARTDIDKLFQAMSAASEADGEDND